MSGKFGILVFAAFFSIFSAQAENWVTELGNCWDALEKDTSAKNQLDRYNEIAECMLNGLPGITKEDASEDEIHGDWLSVLTDFENYWTENCPRTFFLGELKKIPSTRKEKVEYEHEITDEDGKTRKEISFYEKEVPAWGYSVPVVSGVSYKYSAILSLVTAGLHKARKSNWTDIPKNWPASSLNSYDAPFFCAQINGISLYDVTFDVLDGSNVILSGGKGVAGGRAIFGGLDENAVEKVESALEQKKISYSVKDVSLILKTPTPAMVKKSDWVEDAEKKSFSPATIRIESAYTKLPHERHVVCEADARAIVGEEMVNVSGELGSFSVLKNEVTQRLYIDVMLDNPSKFSGANRPAESLSWYDAIFFCNRLSEICLLKPVYSVDGKTDVYEWGYVPHKGMVLGDVQIESGADGFRLPTEEEWIFCARGESGKFDEYSGGIAELVAWTKENSKGKTKDVGEKDKNAFELFDMTGNVWEWCFDVSDETGINRVAHGGAWNYATRYCKIEDRYIRNPKFAYNCLGFRIVKGTSSSKAKTAQDYATESEVEVESEEKQSDDDFIDAK